MTAGILFGRLNRSRPVANFHNYLLYSLYILQGDKDEPVNYKADKIHARKKNRLVNVAVSSSLIKRNVLQIIYVA